MWGKGDPRALLVGMQTGAATVESSVEFPQTKLKMDLPFDPAIPLLGTYPKKPKTLPQKNVSTPMSVRFTITKMGKQPECPSVDEWIKQLWGIYTMEYHSTIKKKKERKIYPLQQHGWTWRACC